MKYIKTYESFKSSRYDKVDEGIIGDLLKKVWKKITDPLKDKFMELMSKEQIAKIDELVNKYKEDLNTKREEKNKEIVEYAKYLQNVIKGGDEDEEEKKKLEENIKKATENFEKEVPNIKKTFDDEIEKIKKEDPSNTYIQKYVDQQKDILKKEIVENELQGILDSTKLKKEDAYKDEFFKTIIDQNEKLKSEIEQSMKNRGDTLGGKEGDSFDLQTAIKDKTYEWKNSPFTEAGNYEWKDGEEITFFSQKEGLGKEDYKGTTGNVIIDDDFEKLKKEGKIKVATANSKKEDGGIEIKLTKVISTTKEVEKEKAAEENNKQGTGT